MSIRPVILAFLALVILLSWFGAYVIYRAAVVGELVAPLEPRSFSALTIVTVGTGGQYENPERRGPTTAVAWGSRIVLVDAGRAIAEALRASSIPVSQPDTVYLTNLLPLNVVGLDDLLFTGWLQPREQPLRLIGPKGTRALGETLHRAYQDTIEAHAESLGLPSEGADLDILEVGDGWTEEINGLRVTAGALGGGPTEALAWRFEANGRTTVISGTGWAPDDLVAFAKDANLLIHEATYIPNPDELEEAGVIADPERLRREAALHTSILDVGTLARRARVEALALVRMRPPPFFPLQVSGIVDDTYAGEIIVPDDGDEISP